MLRLLLKMLLLPPGLLKSHAQGYADLVSEVGARYVCTLKHRWALYALSAMSLMLGLMFAGLALLLWGALPLHNAPHAWILLALPSFFLLLSGLSGWWAQRLYLQPLLQDIQAQWRLDLQAIRQAHPA